MKYLIPVFALCFGAAFAQTTVSPGCSGVSVGGGSPRECAASPDDPRRDNIRAFFNAYESQPKTIIAAMQTYGVNADELASVMDYRINIVHYLRVAGVQDGSLGLHVWDGLSIDQFLIWASPDNIDNAAMRLMAQDALDTAARRKALYVSLGWPVPASIAPWELFQTGHRPPPDQPEPPCTGPNCVTVSP